MNKSNTGIRTKLILLISVVSVGLLALVGASIKMINLGDEQHQYLVGVHQPAIEQTSKMRIATHAVPRFIWLSFTQPAGSPTWKGYIDNLDRFLLDMNESYKKLKNFSNQANLSELENILTNYNQMIGKCRSLIIDAGSDQKKILEARTFIISQMPPLAVPLSKTLEKLDEDIKKKSEQNVQNLEAKIDFFKNTYYFLSAVLIFVVVALGLGIIKSISNSLITISLNLGDTSNVLSVATNQLAIAAKKLASSTERQATAITETSAAVEEISAMVQSTADNSSTMMKVSEDSKETATTGGSIIERMVGSINEIQRANQELSTQVDKSNAQFESVMNAIRGIEEKTKVINDIVFQTKLLSFNASVEAARAGEGGKGFAVVAEEVGQLAASSGKASKEISGMIAESISSIESILEQTKTELEHSLSVSRDRVKQGIETANECAEILQNIRTAAITVTEMTNNVARASQEQSQGVTEISKAMQDLNNSVQANAVSSGVSQRLAGQLFDEAKTLREAAGGLRKLIDGKPLVPKFVWKKDFELGIKAMDDEHIVLVDKINNFASEMDKNSRSSKTLEAFQDLAEYAQKHFADEERYMQSIGYADLQRHKEIHSKLISEVIKVGESLEANQGNPTEIMNFVNDWLVGHIMGVDMHYAEYSRNRGSQHHANI